MQYLHIFVCMSWAPVWYARVMHTYVHDLKQPLWFSHDGVRREKFRGGQGHAGRCQIILTPVSLFQLFCAIIVCNVLIRICSNNKAMWGSAASLVSHFMTLVSHCVTKTLLPAGLWKPHYQHRWSWATHRKVLPEIPFNLPQRCETKQKQSQDLPSRYLLL